MIKLNQIFIESKIMKHYQTVISRRIRGIRGIGIRDGLIWHAEKNKIIIEGEEIPTIGDIIGLGVAKQRTDAVELKKRVQRGS